MHISHLATIRNIQNCRQPTNLHNVNSVTSSKQVYFWAAM